MFKSNRTVTKSAIDTFDLLSMAAKALRLQQQSAMRTALYQTDNFIFDIVPYLQRYARFIVTCVSG